MSSTLRPAIIKRALPALLLCLMLAWVRQLRRARHYLSGPTDEGAGALANGAYDIEFKLFDNADGQQGPTLINEDVTVIDGSFVVILDFGDVFDGTERFLEIAVRPGDSVDDFTVLNPRWPITSTPYAIRSLKAAASDTATTATNASTADLATDATQLGGVAADQYVKTDDPTSWRRRRKLHRKWLGRAGRCELQHLGCWNSQRCGNRPFSSARYCLGCERHCSYYPERGLDSIRHTK